MHLARRGGRKSDKKIRPADVGGYVQGLRLSLAEQDNQYSPKAPPGGKYVRKFPPIKEEEKAKASGVNRLATSNDHNPELALGTQGKLSGESEVSQPLSTVYLLKTMGPAVSAEPPGIASLAIFSAGPPPLVTPTDMRGVTPSDLKTVNNTATEDHVRRHISPDEKWLALETHQTPLFPPEPIISPKWNTWTGVVHGPRYRPRKQ